ncbi:histone-lysine N-methyltransferase, H3 lysine-9 specific SUVH4-like [Chenopodium quinoa]|uniref:histone-lysine N-methyltransferase, H3 lysine-9 specific SUVH4-like n=1 Tax=Chenopodium quinoa TaxID=63459 RepID=UPI000B7971D4|nr:histone-lysine N-methyltransferase, H3 lysine-9 specific SUVH4-like [Chenopodium quinoa]
MDLGNVSNGEFRRRLSPRLHTESNDAGNSGSVPRRFSPRFHNNSSVFDIDSPPGQSSVRGTLSPNSRRPAQTKELVDTPTVIAHSKTPTPKVVATDSNFQRRMSPRLHENLGSTVTPQKDTVSLGISPDVHSISASQVSQVQRRLSPRLHPFTVTNGKLDTSKEPSIKKRVSPRIQGNEENLLETPVPKTMSPAIQREHKNEKKTMSTTPMQRRVSPRLHIKQDNKNHNTILESPVDDKRSLDASLATDVFSAKRCKHDHSKEDNCNLDFECSYVNEVTRASNGETPNQFNMALKAWEEEAKKHDGAPPDAAGRSDHARVKETLRIFNTYYLQCVQEEEERRKRSEIAQEKKKSSTSKEKDVKRTSCRPDLKALTKMREKNEILYPEKTIGSLPGIDVGYQFYSRAEMTAVGFHSHWLNGIDYIGQSKAKKGHEKCTLPIAVAIVMSGQYEDDLDNADDIIYTGEGGHDLLGSKLQQEDQVLVRGNLALKNSMDQSVPIRVVRGRKNAGSYSGKIYSYDGLYKVVDSWADKGCRGHVVYKYRLKRIKGQPKLSMNQVQFIRGSPLKVVSDLPGLVCRDISNGLEDNCIPVTNLVDDPPICPPEFTYIKTVEVAESVKLPPAAPGCSCKGSCTNHKTCACAKLNGQDFPYVLRDGGRLAEPKDVVFECGPNCGCNPGCLNRISQRKIKYRLEVYRTPDKGWAVRSWDYIPSGAPLCEYIGVVRRSDELDSIAVDESNEYIFEIDCLHTINEIEGRERRLGNVQVSSAISIPKIDKTMLDGTPEFCIDAGSRGNVARFINHSCEPNLFVQCILSAHHDLRLARIVLIAADNIPPMQELTYDYGYALDSVIGSDGKVKVLPCFCGTGDCRKRLY